MDEVLGLMEPLTAAWFRKSFGSLTEPQSMAIPVIHERKSVLVSSPTGSGKTLTAFTSILNQLIKYYNEGKLEERIYCIYISPLKALANDVNRNLNEPLRQMRELAAEHMTMVVVTHEMNFAREAASHVIFMADGVIVEQGDPQTFFAHPKEERTRAFLNNML